MMSANQSKRLEESLQREKQLVAELNTLLVDIETSERMIVDLQRELAEVNSKNQGPRTTQQDIEYLSGLLECAKKKLAWEQQITSLRSRTPAILQEISDLLQNRETAPADNSRAEMLKVLQKVQAAMERLSTVNEKT